jgi:hypothetical protein
MSSSSSSSSSSAAAATPTRRLTTRSTAGQRSTGDDFYYDAQSSDDDEIHLTTIPSKQSLDSDDDEFLDPDLALSQVPVADAFVLQPSASAKRGRKRKKNDGSTSSSKEETPTVPWTGGRENIKLPVGKWRTKRAKLEPTSFEPFDLFSLFVTEEVLELWVDYTNKILLKRRQKCKPTSATELQGFIGAHLCMSLVRATSISKYWSDLFEIPILTTRFSRDRFKVLNVSFRISDPESFDDSESNPVSYCKDFIEHCNKAFSLYWKPEQHIAFDESVVAFTGYSKIKQYLPMKPHPFGYKIWAMSTSGYCIRFELYEGADSNETQHSKTHDLIVKFVKGMEEKNYILYVDNFFTSPTLAVDLASKGIAICGSVRINRKRMPTRDQLNDETLKELKRSETMYFRRNDMNLLCWRDQNVLKLLFNHRHINEPLTQVPRYFKSGAWMDVPVHPAVTDYFKYARAVDIVNQYHYSYVIGRKSAHFSTSLMWWCIDVCIINAFQLYKNNGGKQKHALFREKLMYALLSCHTPTRTVRTTRVPPKSGSYEARTHYTSSVVGQKDCLICLSARGQRRRTHYVCVGCDVHLCMGSCFSQYHQ